MKHTTLLYITASQNSFSSDEHKFYVRDHQATFSDEVLIQTREFEFETPDDLDLTAGLIEGLEAMKVEERKKSIERLGIIDQQIATLQCLEGGS